MLSPSFHLLVLFVCVHRAVWRKGGVCEVCSVQSDVLGRIVCGTFGRVINLLYYHKHLLLSHSMGGTTPEKKKVGKI